MDIDELIARELFDVHPQDLQTICKYIAWVKFRRNVHHNFYSPVHWILPTPKPKPTAHWVGR